MTYQAFPIFFDVILGLDNFVSVKFEKFSDPNPGAMYDEAEHFNQKGLGNYAGRKVFDRWTLRITPSEQFFDVNLLSPL